MPADSTSPGVPDLQRRVDELAAELRARTSDYEEALRREAAIGEILQVTNASGGDLSRVFGSIIEKATRLCSAAYGHIWLYDGERARPVAVHGEERFSDWMRRREPLVPGPTPLGRALASKRLVHVVEASEDEGYRSHPLFHELVDRAGVRTMLLVPLLKADRVLGVITAYRLERRPFTDQQIRLLESFAEQAVIAMENARLLDEQREALERQTATAEILTVISQSPTDVGPVLSAVAKAAMKFCGASDAQVSLREGDEWFVAAHEGPIGAMLGRRTLTRHTAPSRAMIDGKVVQITDLQSVEADEFPEARELGMRLGFRSALAAPLLRDDVSIGAISLRRREAGEFSPRQVELLKTFAAQAVIAIENVRLFTELRESLEQQTASAEILEVISQSPTDVEPVLKAVVGAARRFCGADDAMVVLREETEQLLATHEGSLQSLVGTRIPLNRSSATGRATIDGQTFHVPDVASLDPAEHAMTIELTRRTGIRSLLAAPMLREGHAIGCVLLRRPSPGAFTPRQIELLEAFAAQAVIAIENVRLFTELRDSLEQQTATTEVLQTINGSPGKVQPVFEAILEKAMTLCGGAFGLFNTFDGQRFRTAATKGVPEAYARYRVANPPDYSPGTGPARLMAGDDVFHVVDMADSDLYRSGDPNRRSIVDLGGARSILNVALRKEGTLLGMIAIYRQEVRPFSDKQIALVRAFADQAVIAMENARLLGELRQRTNDLQESFEYQGASSAVLTVISRSPTDAQPVFVAIAESAARLCQAEYCHVFRYDGELIHFMASHGQSTEARESIRRLYPKPPGRGSCAARAILNGTVEQVPEVRADPEYTHGEVAEVMKINSIVAVPMLKDGRPVGAISLLRAASGVFPPRQVELLQTFADQAVIAINNVGLFDEVQARAHDLQEALEQQTATAEVLQVINASPGDLRPVFDAMLEKAMYLCEAVYGILWTYDGECYRAAAMRGLPEGCAIAFRDPVRRPHPEIGLGRILRGERLVINTDMAAEAAYLEGDPIRRAMVDIGGARSCVQVALRKDDALLGAFVIYRNEIRPFTDKQVVLLENFAAQAVIAIENARLLTEVREALEQQTASAEILQVISQSPTDAAPVLTAVAKAAVRFCGAEDVTISLQDGAELMLAAHEGPIASEEVGRRYSLDGATIRGRAIIDSCTIHVPDAAAPEGAQYSRTQQLAKQLGFGAVLAAPMLREDKAIGSIALRKSQPGAFTSRQIELLEAFAAQAVIAIENVRLFTELRQRTYDLTESLDQQTATSDVLRTISRSSVDLEAVLETLVQTVARLCRADQAYMFRRRDELHHLVASHGASDETREYMLANPFTPDRGNTSGRVVLERRTIHIPDVLADAEYTYREGQTIAGFRTMLGIPLMREETIIGVFVASRTHVDPFSDKEIALATGFADQAMIAIENARLFEELRDRQAELRVTFDNMGDGVAMFDAEPRLAAWNRNFEEIIGLPEVLLSERPSYADYLRMLAERGEFGTENVEAELASRLENTDRELRLERTRADGTVIEVRRNAVPGGGFVLIYSDVTEQRRAEAAIRAARDAAEAALERQTATADILKVIASSPTDVQPVLAAVVKAAVRFCGATDAMIQLRDGDSVTPVAHEGPLTYSAGDRRSLDRSFTGGRAIVDAQTCHLPDTEALDPVEFVTARRLAARHGFRAAVAAPLKREGTAIGAVVLRKIEPGPFTPQQIALLETFAAQAVIAIENVRLFTELRDSLERLKAAQANLIQSEKMASLGQLTAGIAHEIKNPLNFVNNFAGLSVELLDELKEAAAPVLAGMSEDARAEFGETVDLITANLEKIAEHGKRADGIVKSMLSHSRGGTGDWQECNINALVEEALNLAYHGARAQDQDFNVTLERDFTSEAKPIEVVPQDVTRVFLNLFGNGFYATKKRHLGGADAGFRPTLTVSTRDLGEAVEVRVRDNGTGIMPEVRAKLFRPFFTTKPTGEGTGLGLSISYDIVTQQHSGTIEVESEPGSFTEFTVRLPRSRRVAQSRGT